MTQERTKVNVVELYQKYNDFEKAVQLSGMPTLAAHIKLLASGVLKIQDKIDFCSNNVKLGALAEREFQKLVPNAIDYNRIVKKNNPIFDFKYGDLTIDVKYSSRQKRGNHLYWNVKTTKADILVCFLEAFKGSMLKNADILLIPQAFINVKQNIHLSQNNNLYYDCKVEKEELKDILDQYNKFLTCSYK